MWIFQLCKSVFKFWVPDLSYELIRFDLVCDQDHSISLDQTFFVIARFEFIFQLCRLLIKIYALEFLMCLSCLIGEHFLCHCFGNYIQVSFQVADALNQPFPDDEFDLVWSMESGEHMPDKEKVNLNLLLDITVKSTS